MSLRDWRENVTLAPGRLLRTFPAPPSHLKRDPKVALSIRLYEGRGPSFRSFTSAFHHWLCVGYALKRHMRTTYDWIEIVSMDSAAVRGWTAELQLFEDVDDVYDSMMREDEDVRA